MSLLHDIFYILFPPVCSVCGRMMGKGEKVMCTFCLLDMPRTDYHLLEDNPVEKLFWGRVPVAKAAGYFFYTKGSSYQRLIHKLKYKSRTEIGEFLGEMYGNELVETDMFNADFIIPVPLHPMKERLRGYNQSEFIAQGIASIFDTPVITDVLIRKKNTSSQTRKSRFDRSMNMEGMFAVKDKSKIEDCSILLVDDVVTTGSTLEACASVLLENGCREVMVATLGVS